MSGVNHWAMSGVNHWAMSGVNHWAMSVVRGLLASPLIYIYICTSTHIECVSLLLHHTHKSSLFKEANFQLKSGCQSCVHTYIHTYICDT